MAINKTVRNAIADGAVTSDKIEDGAITSGKLGEGSISLSKTPLGNAAPTISSLDTSQIDPDSGATVTITGTGFVSIPDVRFMNTSTGVRIQASTVGFTSSTTITAAFPSGQTPGTYKVLVENPDGKGAISTSTITYSAAPTWSTAANLGSIEEGEAVNIQLLAYDDDSTAVSSYSLVSGSLPSGVTLSGDSSVGALTGTAPAVDADTNYTFTIRATDDESQTSDREFTLTITNWTVANSLRFDDGSSDYLIRTPASTTNRKTFTFSAWIKLGSGFGNERAIYTGHEDANQSGFITVMIDTNEKLTINYYESAFKNVTTNRVFRDTSAWYHIVVAVDTTQATDSDRIKLYVNGSEETSLATAQYPSLNFNFNVNDTQPEHIGVRRDGSANLAGYWDGYIAEAVRTDGSQLDPTSFGETDTASGIWKPKSVSGLTFGTNGFYLPFTNSASLGADSSGNSNDFTVNNLTAIDQTTDTPTNNYATFNPLMNNWTDVSDGNLKVTNTSQAYRDIFSTVALTSGKWYVECRIDTEIGGTYPIFGIADASDYSYPAQHNLLGRSTNGYGFQTDGNYYHNNADAGNWSTLDSGDIIGFYLDLDSSTKTLKVYKNGSSELSININDPIDGYYFGCSTFQADNVSGSINFGNPNYTISSGNSDANGYGNFEYSPTINSVNYFALNTKNLAEYG